MSKITEEIDALRNKVDFSQAAFAKYMDCRGKVKIIVENNGEALKDYVQKTFACEADYETFVDAVTDEKDQIENRARAVRMLLNAPQKHDDTMGNK